MEEFKFEVGDYLTSDNGKEYVEVIETMVKYGVIKMYGLRIVDDGHEFNQSANITEAVYEKVY